MPEDSNLMPTLLITGILVCKLNLLLPYGPYGTSRNSIFPPEVDCSHCLPVQVNSSPGGESTQLGNTFSV